MEQYIDDTTSGGDLSPIIVQTTRHEQGLRQHKAPNTLRIWDGFIAGDVEKSGEEDEGIEEC